VSTEADTRTPRLRRRATAARQTAAAASALVLAASLGAHAQPSRDEAEQDFFLTSSQCIACHSHLTSPAGEDISIGYHWRSSMMANSAHDPYWQAAVRRETIDHPHASELIEDECSICHMPMAHFISEQADRPPQIFASLNRPFATDGVSCAVCHQIRPDNFGDPSSFTGGFVVDAARPAGERQIFGPYDVNSGHRRIMSSATQFVPTQADHLRDSELCATCHTLYTHAFNAAGDEVGQLPEQVPYLEWRHSEYRETNTCQSCHMPPVEEPTPITSVLGEERPQLSRHTFFGGNAFMLRILSRHRGELGVTALPQELDATIRGTTEFLSSQSADISIRSARVDASGLLFDVSVNSLTGHKLPSAYPSRRAWLHVTVEDGEGRVLFESGALRPDGSVAGNENDADPSRYEPHYAHHGRLGRRRHDRPSLRRELRQRQPPATARIRQGDRGR
jgi:hypothetical protein